MQTSRTILVMIWTHIGGYTEGTIKALVSEGYTSDCVGRKSLRFISFVHSQASDTLHLR